MNSRLFILLLVLFMIAGAQAPSDAAPAPSPTPTATLQPLPSIPIHVRFFPFVAMSADAPSGNKLCLAWSYYGLHDVVADGFDFWCYHKWTVVVDDQMGLHGIVHIAGRYWPYDAIPQTAVIDYLRDLAVLPPDFDEITLFLNEPDLAGQSNMSAVEAVKFYIAIRAMCPYCQLTLPQVSHEDYRAGWPWLRAFTAEYKRVTGELPDVSFGAIHTYIQNEPPRFIIDSYAKLLAELGFGELPILVTEWGGCSTAVIEDMFWTFENDPRVMLHFYYSPYSDEHGVPHCSNLYDGKEAEAHLNEIGLFVQKLHEQSP